MQKMYSQSSKLPLETTQKSFIKIKKFSKNHLQVDDYCWISYCNWCRSNCYI